MTYDEWIKWLKINPENVGRQSGNGELDMTIRGTHFYNKLSRNDTFKKKLLVEDFSRQRRSSRERYKYWKVSESYDHLSIEDIINNI